MDAGVHLTKDNLQTMNVMVFQNKEISYLQGFFLLNFVLSSTLYDISITPFGTTALDRWWDLMSFNFVNFSFKWRIEGLTTKVPEFSACISSNNIQGTC
ncbi:hypothetical protein ACJX0J_041250, partial [Zea mays]